VPADPKDEVLNSIYSKIPRDNLAYSGDGSGGTYAHLTLASMEKIFQAMRFYTGFGRQSGLVDIGGGLGVPALHAATALRYRNTALVFDRICRDHSLLLS
jgi:hypothetical protein